MENIGNSALIYFGLLIIAGVLYYAIAPQLKRIADLMEKNKKNEA